MNTNKINNNNHINNPTLKLATAVVNYAYL